MLVESSIDAEFKAEQAKKKTNAELDAEILAMEDADANAKTKYIKLFFSRSKLPVYEQFSVQKFHVLRGYGYSGVIRQLDTRTVRCATNRFLRSFVARGSEKGVHFRASRNV